MKRKRSGRRRAIWAAASIIALSGMVALGLPAVVRGPRFGRIVHRVLPETRGEIRVGGGQWTWAAAWALLRGRPARLVLDDVRITDPEGTEVLRAHRLAGELAIHRDRSEVVIRHLEVAGAAWRFANMRSHPGIGFLVALEPKPKPRPTGASKPDAVPNDVSFRIEDARLDGLDVALEFPDWGLLLKDVQAIGWLSFDQKGGKQAVAFHVQDAEARGGGRLRILDRPIRIELPFSRARLDEVSSSGASAASAPDSIVLAASAIVTGHSTLSLRGTFVAVLAATGPERPAGIDLRAHIDDAADAIQQILTQNGLASQVQVTGRSAGVDLRFWGPFEKMAIGAQTHGFVLRRGLLEGRDFGFQLSADLAAAHVRLSNLSLASPAGGRLSLEGDVDPARASATLILDGLRVPAGPLLPIILLPLAETTLRGRVTVRMSWDTKAVFFDDLALTVLRPANVTGPHIVPRILRVHSRGVTWMGGSRARSLRVSGARLLGGALELGKVTTALAGGRLTARGRLVLWDVANDRWLPSPVSDLVVQADRISIQRLLGNAFVAGTISARVRVGGQLQDSKLRVDFPPGESVTILGERFQLPSVISLHLGGQGLHVDPVHLHGVQGAELGARGRLGLDSRLDLAVSIHDYPFRKLPALKDTDLPFAGRISGELQLSGDVGEPALSGRLSIDDTAFGGRPIGGGSLTITSEPRGGIRARGQLMEGVYIDGSLAPQPAGLEGDGELRFSRLRLDPFLSGLPGGITAAGTVTGTARIGMSPSHPPRLAALLTELAFMLRGAAPASAGIELHSEGEVQLSLEGGRGAALRLPLTRLVGTAGSFEVAGQSEGGASSLSLRGRLNLGALAPLARHWMDTLSGAVDLDLHAAIDSTGRPWAAKGRASIAVPVSFTLRAQPGLGLARISAGELEMDDSTLRLRAVAIGVGRTVSMTIGGGRGAPGTILFRTSSPRGIAVAHVDLPMRGDVHGLLVPVASVDSATFALRLEGAPRQQLRLEGDVELFAARARPGSVSPASVAAGGSSPWLAQPEIARTQLDVRVKATSGAVVVTVPHAPDLRVNADFRIRGTVAHPQTSGDVRGATVYSSLALFLYRLFH
jgi:hypothetical protein